MLVGTKCESSFPTVICTEIIEDVPGTGDTGESSQTLAAPPPPSGASHPNQERESYKKLGLTKQVLAAHTQKEEQAFLYRFRELRGLAALKANCSQYLQRQRGHIVSDGMFDHHTDTSCQRPLKGYGNFFFSFCYLPPSRVPNKKTVTILSTVRAVTRKTQAEPTKFW